MTKTHLRMFVVGTGGQLSTALQERAQAHDWDAVAVGHTEIDLSENPDVIVAKVMASAQSAAADVIVNAAAYTAVDKAEDEPSLAEAVNGVAPGALAIAAQRLNLPLIHVSTDYVFDGKQAGHWCEDDTPNPLGVYGLTKLMGEKAVAEATQNHAILRTAWVYAPFGANFVRTMLRLAAEGRQEIGVVADQVGCPTNVLDIADAIFAVARNMVSQPQRDDLRGVFHLVGEGETSWAEFAKAIFEGAQKRGAPIAHVKAIATADYPTKAQRPENSRLSTDKIKRLHGINMPNWKSSLDGVLDRLLNNV